MHIPDGLIPLDQSVIYLVISLIILAISFYFCSKKTDMGKRLVLNGVLTAIVIVATSVTIPSPMGIPMHFFHNSSCSAYIGSIQCFTSFIFGIVGSSVSIGHGWNYDIGS